MATTKHTLVALVEDKPGVLNHMASLFRRRGFNIKSITVGHSELAHQSRVTIIVDGANTKVEQVRKQLDKIVNVVKVTDLSGDNIIIRELALIKVKATATTRSEIIQIVDTFRAKIVDVGADSLTVEVTGDEPKIETLFNLLRGFGIQEMSRTGTVAMARGNPGALPVAEKPARAAPKQPKPK
ncbi:acetolactate synthase small subunit [Chloroflexota bacterium]